MATHTPYGYVIEDGKAMIDEVSAKQVRQLYENYLSGDSLQNSAAKAGINKFHSGISRMLVIKSILEQSIILPLLIEIYLVRCKRSGTGEQWLLVGFMMKI